MTRTHGVTHWQPDTCFGCQVHTLHLRPTTAFKSHYNVAVGQHVDTERQFRDALKRRAEENTIATGTEHNYEMRDPSELAATVPYPAQDDIIDAQGRALTAMRNKYGS